VYIQYVNLRAPLLAFLAALLVATAAYAEPSPQHLEALRRGINITGWFRFPASQDAAALRGWIGDLAVADLRRAGFTFVRLAVDPDLPSLLPAVIEATRRLHSHGLAVVIAPHPHDWRLETSPADRARLLAFWRNLAPQLATLDPNLTYPELLNEPVFPRASSAWQSLQRQLVAELRARLPRNTIILTGNDWGSIGGLLDITPDPDPDVVYSFHFYDPPELTALAAYHPGLDRTALGRLPFPISPAECASAASAAHDDQTRAVIHAYCAYGWSASVVRQRLARAAEWARRNHAALIAGEFGASIALNPAARLTWITAVRQACEAEDIGWALWGYDDSMGFAVPRPPGSRPHLDAILLRALGLTIPDGSQPTGK
jgi:endoglucanase